MSYKLSIISYCFTLLVVLCAASTQDAVIKPRSIARPPQNVATLPGSTVILVCEVDKPPPESRTMWGEYITNPGGSIISDNLEILAHPNKERYRILNPTPTEFHLEIRDVQLTDGGTYMCQDTLATAPGNRGEAELIVLASNPNCTSTAPLNGDVIEGQNYTIECTVNFRGAFAPIMTWSGPPPFNTGHSPPNPTSVWSGVAYTVNRDMDTRSFECLTNFTDLGALPDDVASNVPTWSYLHRAPQIFVFWGPKNITATPIKPEYQVDDVITCWADAWPSAIYKWTNIRTQAEVNGDKFPITQDLVGFNQTMRCQALNIIQGFIFSENIFLNVYVPAPTSPTTPTTTPPKTTQPLESSCNDLSGHWRSEFPYAEMLLEVVVDGELGEVIGILKNQTDTTWVEVVGTTRKGDFAYLGLSAIWPLTDGVTGMSGECHRCSGEEIIFSDGLWRSRADSSSCGDGGNPQPHNGHQYRRVGSVRSALDSAELKVWKPSSISKHLRVNLKK